MNVVLLGFALLLQNQGKREVTCPVDGTKFFLAVSGYAPPWGGIDSDFCPHPTRPQALALHCAVCPTCGFAAMAADFERGTFSPEQKRNLLESLRPPNGLSGKGPHSLPGHVRYEQLALTRIACKAPPIEIGRAYLQAAWTIRVTGAISLDGFEEFEELQIRKGFAKTPLELRGKNKSEVDLQAAEALEKAIADKPLKGLDADLSHYLLAYAYRLHGENLHALSCLKRIEPGQNSVVDQASDAMRKNIAIEGEYQQKALREFQAALESPEGMSDRSRVELQYLAGETARRLGDADAARRWFSEVLKNKENKELAGLVKLAVQQDRLVSKTTK